jgi:hypothetical protein
MMDYKTILTGFTNAGKLFLGICAVLGSLYAGLWSLGIAPMTNSQAEDMIDERVKKKGTELKNLMVEQGIAYDEQLQEQKTVVDDIDDNVDAIREQNARIDERTKRTEDLLNLLLNKLGQ